MLISLIVAIDQEGVIGSKGALPWRLPADLRYFKSVTMGKPVIMGRKTYETIGKPLHGRHNIVMTRAKDVEAPGCTVVHSAEAALVAAGDVPEVMIIGGAQIYRHFLPRADRLYLTRIEATFKGDTFFPPIAPDQWRTVWEERHAMEEGHPYSFRFVIMKRKRCA